MTLLTHPDTAVAPFQVLVCYDLFGSRDELVGTRTVPDSSDMTFLTFEGAVARVRALYRQNPEHTECYVVDAAGSKVVRPYPQPVVEDDGILF